MAISTQQTTANDKDVWSRLTGVFRDVFDAPALELSPATTAADIDEWDSVGYITLIVSVEREFGIELIGPEIGALQSAGDMVRLIEQKQSPSS